MRQLLLLIQKQVNNIVKTIAALVSGCYGVIHSTVVFQRAANINHGIYLKCANYARMVLWVPGVAVNRTGRFCVLVSLSEYLRLAVLFIVASLYEM